MCKKLGESSKKCINYYPFGMPMPDRNVEGDYRYGYQGEFAEKDPETGLNAFELRLWDSRIGRWLTTDPMHEFVSPYLGMGNNPISRVDPTGGKTGKCPPDCDGTENLPLGATPLIGEGGFVSKPENWHMGGQLEVVDISSPSLAGAPNLIPYYPPMSVIPGGNPTPGPKVNPSGFLGVLSAMLLLNGDSSPDIQSYSIPDSDFDRPEDTKKWYLYRAMRNNGGVPEIGDISLAQLGVRDADVLDENRKIINPISSTDLKGMSVTPWDPALTYPPPTANKPLWRIGIWKLNMGEIWFFQDGINHAIIIPTNSTSLNTFRENVHKTAIHWELVN